MLAPCARATALASSNRATGLCTRNIASISGAAAPHPDEKMSSTTCRDEWPSGSSPIVRNGELTEAADTGDGMNAYFGFFLGRGLPSCRCLSRSCSPLRLSQCGGFSCFQLACRAGGATESLKSSAAAHETGKVCDFLVGVGDGATTTSALPYDLQLREWHGDEWPSGS